MSKFAGLGIAADVTSKLYYLHPVSGVKITDKDGKAAYIEVRSLDSKAAKDHERAVINRRMNQKIVKPSAELMDQDTTDLYVALTAGWYLLDLNGNPIDVPFTADNARELYSEQSFAWLREQVSAHCSDRQNFIPG